MAPPFLAYYGAATGNLALLRESVFQCGAYRDTLQLKNGLSDGLWQHIIGPENFDPGLWSTGNGWAAAGMARVLATVLKAPVAQQDPSWRDSAITSLTTWIKEIVDGAMNAPSDGGLLRNYLNDTVSAHGFGETSGSALLASVVYRMVVMRPQDFDPQTYVGWAQGIRRALGLGWFDQKSFQWVDHVDKGNGTVRPAVNPLGWDDVNPYMLGSPEGQEFVVMLYAAWRDCVAVGKCGIY
jgi:rhamnogalacturonyl hydrolase YesR